MTLQTCLMYNKAGGGGDLETEYDQVEDLWKLGSLQRKFNQFFVGELFQYFPTFKKNFTLFYRLLET